MVAEAWAAWHREVDHAREVLAGVGDGRRASSTAVRSLEVRELIVHMLEEYARHMGHVACSASASAGAPGSQPAQRAATSQLIGVSGSGT